MNLKFFDKVDTSDKALEYLEVARKVTNIRNNKLNPLKKRGVARNDEEALEK